MAPATAVLVHGPCGTPAVWSRVVPLLDDVGVPSVAVHLPSSLAESELDDAAFLRSVLDDCDEAAVLVGHSSGGVPITEVGDHRAVKHLVYLDGAMWDVGESAAELMAGQIAEGFAACVKRHKGGTVFDTDALAASLQGRGWSADDAREFVSGFVPSRVVAMVREVTVATWRTMPSTFISYTDSEMSSQLRGRFAARATEVIEMPGDHFPQWRRPGAVAEIIARVARDAVTQ
jgi:pimeloyl-ACP methyl ester carboxylesterase